MRRESETGATQKRSAQKGAAVSESDERITEQKSESEEIELAADVDELLPPPPMPMRRSACDADATQPDVVGATQPVMVLNQVISSHVSVCLTV